MKSKTIIVIGFLALVGLILSAKAYQMGWFTDHEPLSLNNQPAILFFNSDRGCECMLFVFRQADRQIAELPMENRNGIQLIPINLERRQDLASQYKVVRAPTLILLDSAGQVVWRQDEVLSDEVPLNLPELDSQILAFSQQTEP